MVSPSLYASSTIGISTWKVGLLYSSTLMEVLPPLVLMVNLPVSPLDGKVKSRAAFPYSSVTTSFVSTSL